MTREKIESPRARPEVEQKPKLVGITVRVDVETNRLLSAILSLKGMTLSSFMQDSIKNFIKENYHEAKELYDNMGCVRGYDQKD
jgi:hypothetical protein